MEGETSSRIGRGKFIRLEKVSFELRNGSFERRIILFAILITMTEETRYSHAMIHGI